MTEEQAWRSPERSGMQVVCYGGDQRFWAIEYTGGNAAGWTFGSPSFELEGRMVSGALATLAETAPRRTLTCGVTEYRVGGPLRDAPGTELHWIVRVADGGNPVVRFRYELASRDGARLTKRTGSDRLRYLSASLDGCDLTVERRLSEFVEPVHSYCPTERQADELHFRRGETLMGPLLTAGGGNRQLLLAYEHGSQYPDAFIQYRLRPDRTVELEAVKGNYLDGSAPTPERPYRTVWMQAAAIEGDEDALASHYRRFALRHWSENAESRRPYIFYNTWNYQERVRNEQGGKYLDPMRLKRTLLDIDAAHELGVEVYVLDTGWYGRTGDWRADPQRFPDDLREVRTRLDGYGMKLGLWFNPTVAALGSEMLAAHRDCVMSEEGREAEPAEVWETEASVPLCLASRYADAFAGELIRLARDYGVRYFKWDAIAQYGCDAPGHDHGDAGHTRLERRESYAFQQVQAMARIVDRLCAACPQAIVDFDVTEGGRAMGLAFLGSGKYFLVNNGPYYFNYDVPIDRERDNWNLFFHPGPARGWICRRPLAYDRWLPSTLFLAHYLPDAPRDNQLISLASLMLGHNGLWGDLPALSRADREFIRETLDRYKQVRDDIADSDPVREGEIGGAAEAHEKLSAMSGRGLVALFSATPGTYSYATKGKPARPVWHTEGVRVSWDASGRAVIEAEFSSSSAAIVLFGAQ